MHKIAIVGAGYMATEHARAFAAWPGVRIVGFCGRSHERAEALAAQHNTVAYSSIDTMRRATGADAVVVAVNELSMKTVYQEVFGHDWAVLLEKPVGVDLAEASEIEALAGRHRAWVALNRRAYGATRAALSELEAAGGDGGPRLISVLDQQDMVAARSIGHPECVVRNFMYANSIHLVDYLTVFGRGEVVGVEAGVRFDPAQPGFVVANVRFSSGDVGVYQAVWDGPGPWAVSVTNRRVRVDLRPLEQARRQLRGERRVFELEADPRDQEFKPGLHRQAGWLLDELAGTRTPLPSLGEAMRSTRLVSAIYGV
jgi:predicted dehydrogenase